LRASYYAVKGNFEKPIFCSITALSNFIILIPTYRDSGFKISLALNLTRMLSGGVISKPPENFREEFGQKHGFAKSSKNI